jgi:hypothetical protein
MQSDIAGAVRGPGFLCDAIPLWYYRSLCRADILTMIKSILSVLYLTSLFAQPHSTAQPHVYPGRAGLTLVAIGKDGLALASDGEQLNADGTTSEVQKIFPIGKTAAVVLAGEVSAQDPVTRPVREEFNAARITELWLNAHPDATFESASRDLSALMLEGANRFFSKRNPGRRAAMYKFALLFVSYSDGKPSISGTRYFMPAAMGKPMRTEAISSASKSGEMWIFGLVKVPQELLTGNSAALKKYKADPAINGFRSSHPDQLSAQGLLPVFEVVLQAAESTAGKKFDPGRGVIGPPNRLATITADSGFSWGKKQ